MGDELTKTAPDDGLVLCPACGSRIQIQCGRRAPHNRMRAGTKWQVEGCPGSRTTVLDGDPRA